MFSVVVVVNFPSAFVQDSSCSHIVHIAKTNLSGGRCTITEMLLHIAVNAECFLFCRYRHQERANSGLRRHLQFNQNITDFRQQFPCEQHYQRRTIERDRKCISNFMLGNYSMLS